MAAPAVSKQQVRILDLPQIILHDPILAIGMPATVPVLLQVNSSSWLHPSPKLLMMTMMRLLGVVAVAAAAAVVVGVSVRRNSSSKQRQQEVAAVVTVWEEGGVMDQDRQPSQQHSNKRLPSHGTPLRPYPGSGHR